MKDLQKGSALTTFLILIIVGVLVGFGIYYFSKPESQPVTNSATLQVGDVEVTVPVDTARYTGYDAAIKSDLDDTRAQAENYYDSNGASYSGVCTSRTGILYMLQAVLSIEGATGINTTYGTAGSAGIVTCHDAATGWTVEAPLKSVPMTFWCVDSTGTSSSHTNHIAANAVACTPG